MQGQHGFREQQWGFLFNQPWRSTFLIWIVATILFSFLSVFNAASAETRPGGDLAPLNAPDGVLNAGDVLILQRIVMGSLIATPEQQLVGDVAPLGNPDGVLNAADVVVLMRAVMGQVSLPPVYLGPDPPVLANASGVANDNPLPITGTAEPGYLIRLYVNGALQASTTAATDGSFSFAATLMDGNNALYAALVDAGSEGPVSSLLEIDYQNNRPRNQSGVISQDSVWSPGITPTPYVISGDLSIAPGATLILLPGTTLQFDTGVALNVNGGLQVRGTPAAPVTFTSSNSPAVPGDWVGIRLNSGSTANSLDNAVVEYANIGIQVDGTQVQISNSTIREIRGHWSSKGIAFMNSAGGVVENSTVIGIVAGFRPTGIEIQDSDPHIRNNSITTTDAGIFVQNASPWLSGNQITNSSKGIYLYEGARALVNDGNVLSGNSVGLQFGGTGFGANPDSIVTNNSVFNNQWNVYISGYDRPQDVEVPLEGNWWGSVSPSVISSSIFDHKDVWGEGAPPARVVPYLDGPGGQPVPGNFLGGRVSVDTTLVAGEPYTVISSYVLSPDISLTIPPGTDIAFASNAVLHARGSLFVQGQEDNRVTFNSAADTQNLPPGWGVLVGDLAWQGIIAEAEITGAQFDNLFFAVEVGAATATVSDSLFTNNDTAILYVRNSSGSILSNTISGRKLNGARKTIGLAISGNYPITVAKNTITGVSYGIHVSQYGNPLIQGNVISETTYGCYVISHNPSDNVAPVIDAGNTIVDNDYGFFSYKLKGSVSVTNNNIYNNGVNYHKEQSLIIEDATSNWWGTTVEAEVASGIYQESSNTVTYVPFLTGPVPVTPVLTATTLLTNNSSYAVSGTAQAGVQVRIYVNAVAQTTVTAQPNGQFAGTVTLSEGENSIHAEAFNATTTSSPSASLQVTLDTSPPTITLDTPANSALINRYPTFTGSINEPATLTIASQPITVTADNRFTHGPVTLTEGANSTAVVATDLAGNTTTRIIYLTLDTTPPPNPNLTLISFGSLSNGSVTVTGAAGAVEPGAWIHFANGRSGETVKTFAAADGSFTLNLSAAPGDSLGLVVTDDIGNQTAWARELVAGTAPSLSITSTYPTEGAIITGDRVTITGTFTGPENTGINVAGQVATRFGDHFMATDVPLTTGANAIDITLSTDDGATLTQSLNLSATGTIPFNVSMKPERAFTPLIGRLTLVNDSGAPMQQVQLDLNDDGIYENNYTNLDYTEAYFEPLVYVEPGLHRGRVRVVDNTGATYNLTFAVMVEEPIGMEMGLRALYQRMLDQLGQNDIPGALNRFMGTSRARFEQIFNHLSADLPSLAINLGVVDFVEMGSNWGQLRVVRDEAGQKRAYYVTVVRDEDGIWRIEGM